DAGAKKADRVAVGIAQSGLAPEPVLVVRPGGERDSGSLERPNSLVEVIALEKDDHAVTPRDFVHTLDRQRPLTISTLESGVVRQRIDDLYQAKRLVELDGTGHVG